EAPMLYIGEKVGLAQKDQTNHRRWDEVDIAVDPLEGTNLCATGAANAIAVLAPSEKGGPLHAPDLHLEKTVARATPAPAPSQKGGLLHAPDLYMEKLVVAPTSKHLVDLDAPVRENLRAI